MPQVVVRYILCLVSVLFSTGVFGQFGYDDIFLLPAEDTSSVVKLPSAEGRNSVVSFTATSEKGEKGLIDVAYYDGFGRVREEVSVGITPSGNDLVALHEYSSMTRKSWQGIPVPVASSGEGCVTTTKYLDATSSVFGDSRPYTLFSYEQSSLDRLVSVTGPGEKWHETGRAVRHGYMTNSGSADTLRCLYYTVSETQSGIAVSVTGYYADGSLMVTRTEDEDNETVLVFTDMRGRKVLSRVIDHLSGLILYDTYYVYDDKGCLRVVLPPELSAVSKSGVVDGDLLDKYAFIYSYDKRHRMCTRKMPGADVEHIIYDAADRVVYRQDGEMRKQRLCMFTAYDVFGRECVTGSCSYRFPSDVCSYLFNKLSSCTYTGGANNLMGYTCPGMSLPESKVLTANFYDDYSFIGDNNELSYKEEESYGRRYLRATGLKTGTVTARLSSDTGAYVYDTTAIYYDDRGRIIQTKSTNHLGGHDCHYYSYDFTGNETCHKHILTYNCGYRQTLEEVSRSTYDHAGRLLTTVHSINGCPPVTIADNEYDETGRLLSDRRNGNAALHVTYDYNIRSWPVSISTSERYVKLHYNDLSHGRYGGDVSDIEWSDDGKDNCIYSISYDGLSRIVGASFFDNHLFNGRNTVSYSYDMNGNITSLVRKGSVNTSSIDIDCLSLEYDGNRLKRVTNSASGLYRKGMMRFVDGAEEDVEYEYDSNGNLSADLNKGISGISYNIQNRPRKVSFADGKSISYTYNSSGDKLRAEYVLKRPVLVTPELGVMDMLPVSSRSGDFSGGIRDTVDRPLLQDTLNFGNTIQLPYGVRILDYCDNVLYDNYKLDRVLFDGGYITFSGSSPIYHFYFTDHLGNVRAVYNQDGTVEQINRYYPFGALFYNSDSDEFQRYKFNGKELDRLLALDWYDYGARMYDPVLCRWNSIDPLADKYCNVSPYVYCLNNPVNHFDPDGRSVWTKLIKGGFRISKTVAKKGFSALAKADTYYDAVSDITENTRTLFSSDASVTDRIWAGAGLVSEIAPISIGDLKDAKKGLESVGIIKAAHGNSKASAKAQHAYDIVDKEKGTVVKTGVSGGKVRKDGKSYRAERQVRKWNRQAGYDKYESVITHWEPAGDNARDKIYKYERKRADELKRINQLDKSKHKKP